MSNNNIENTDQKSKEAIQSISWKDFFSYYKTPIMFSQILEEISGIVSKLRNYPPSSIAGEKVLKVIDLLKNEITDREKNIVTKGPDLPISNVISFELSSGSRIIVRPSGTEPKIKYYFNLRGENIEILNKRFLDSFWSTFQLI